MGRMLLMTRRNQNQQHPDFPSNRGDSFNFVNTKDTCRGKTIPNKPVVKLVVESYLQS